MKTPFYNRIRRHFNTEVIELIQEEIAFMGVSELHKHIRNKNLSPVEITTVFLERIQTLNPILNAFLTITAEYALDQAKICENSIMKNDPVGPLHGIPISIKDLEETKSIRTTFGSKAFENYIPEYDSIVVERVKKAGGIILGKTNTPEFGFKGTTENLLGDACKNPWNTSRTSGGSSGGAAASVASGMSTLATGSDGGGSIRIPSSFCGTFGIKPTLGRVPKISTGSLEQPPAHNILTQSGPITRSVEDAAILLNVLSGSDTRDLASPTLPKENFLEACGGNVKGLRIGWTPDFGYTPVDDEVLKITKESALSLESLGCSVEESDLKLVNPTEHFLRIFACLIVGSRNASKNLDLSQLTDYAQEGFKTASRFSGADYGIALGYTNLMKLQFEEQFQKFDLLISPTMSVTAFEIGHNPTTINHMDVDPIWGYTPFTFPINMIGYPAASIPCGFSSDGLPIGLHIIGRNADERTIIKLSSAIEKLKPWPAAQTIN